MDRLPREFVLDMAIFLAQKISPPEVSRPGRELLAQSIFESICEFEATQIGQHGEDQRFMSKSIDTTKLTDEQLSALGNLANSLHITVQGDPSTGIPHASFTIDHLMLNRDFTKNSLEVFREQICMAFATLYEATTTALYDTDMMPKK